MAISVSFPFSKVAQPEARGPVPCWVLFSLQHHFSNSSISKLSLIRGAWELPLLGASFLYRILSLTAWISCALSYIIVQRLLHYQAEITVMQFTGHSLPVHQFVTVPWDFNPVPYCLPSSPTPMEYALLLSLEWHVWRGRRSIYYNTKDKEPSLLCYLPLDEGRIFAIIPFPVVLALCEMQTASSRILHLSHLVYIPG